MLGSWERKGVLYTLSSRACFLFGRMNDHNQVENRIGEVQLSRKPIPVSSTNLILMRTLPCLVQLYMHEMKAKEQICKEAAGG